MNYCRLSYLKINIPALSRCYAVKAVGGSAGLMGLGKGKKSAATGKGGPMTEKPTLPVETDVNKLLNYVCGSNIAITGEDVQLKPDSEYPDWLWTLRTGPKATLAEMDPNTKEYWQKVRKLGIRRNNQQRKFKPLR